MSDIPAVERRKEPRAQIGRCLLRLDPRDGRDPIVCFVWDMSESGARLKLSQDVPLPSILAVLIGNVTRTARLIWRKEDHLGIEFCDQD
jgi:hypothetical protein